MTPMPYPPPARPPRPGAGRTAAIAAGVTVAAVVIGSGTAFLLYGAMDRPDGAGQTASATPGVTATGSGTAAAGRCSYPASTAERQSTQRSAGTPPPNPEYTGTVRATLTTDRGDIVIELDANRAPCTVNSFTHLVSRRYFDAQPCHRLTTAQELRVLQCGDPTGTGTGGPGYRFAEENASSRNIPPGTVAMARTAQPGSNGSQFFIAYDEIASLGQPYSIFGKVVSGLQVIEDVAEQGTDDANGPGDGRPKRGITIERVRLSA
jgi:peptidyl-prolyl cis-trans isomerase B (cyclophilin B)